MSGGVDSSVAAALLQKRGFHVVGVYFKPWSPGVEARPRQISRGLASTTYCNWQQDRQDAMRVAAKLGIEFKTWDFSKIYGEKVAKYMVDGYRAGITPNPDVMCNKEIKFGLFLKKALKEGADYIATGHYAITKNNKLYKAKDKNKDQTYFLWTLTQEQLKHCLFPIGQYTKPEVRKLAKQFGLPTHNKKDSQGVCFVGELDMHDFLTEYIKPKPGPIVLLRPDLKGISRSGLENPIIGTHDGSAYYTIGQRHGLNITIGGGPYYVIQKVKNTLFVAKSKIKSQNAKVSEIHWIGNPHEKIEVKIRYRAESVPAKIINGELFFDTPVNSITPGQSAVMYSGQEVLGGGIFQSSPTVAESASILK